MLLSEDEVKKLKETIINERCDSEANKFTELNLIETLEHYRRAIWFINSSSNVDEIHRIALEALEQCEKE